MIPSHSGAFQQGLQSQVVRIGQLFKPVPNDHPVLTDNRYHVGNGADRDKLQEVLQNLLPGKMTKQRVHQLEDHTDTGEILVGIGAVRTTRV